MAKKLNSSDYLLFGLIATGGVGYYLYKNGKLPIVDKLMAKVKKEDTAPKDTVPDTTPVVEKVVNAKPTIPATQQPAYIDKVKKIQVYLGVGVDGNAGSSANSQTNQALKKKFVTEYPKLGNLTPSNVDAYLTAMVEKNKQETAVQKSASVSKQRKDFGEKLRNLYTKNKAKIVRKTDSNSPTKYYDQARKQYSNDGKSLRIVKDYPIFPSFSYVGYTTDGYWILKSSTGKFVIQNPNEYVAK